MKKRWKIFWIICAVMFIIGLSCCVVADKVLGVRAKDIVAEFPNGIVAGSGASKYIYQADNDWDDDRDDDDWDDDDRDDDDWDDDDRDDDDWDDDHAGYTENNTNPKEKNNMINGNGKAAYQQIKKIKGKIYAGTVYFKTAATDEITVESKETHENLGFQAYEKNGILYLKTNDKVRTKKNIGKGSITVTLPKSQRFEDVNLILKAGELNMDEISADELEVKSGAGEVFVENFTVNKAEFECGAGSISGAGDVANTLDIDCGVGEINLKLKGNQNDYDYDLECGVGEIKCGKDTYSGFGKDVYLDNQGSKKMNLECGIGQITIDYVTEL